MDNKSKKIKSPTEHFKDRGSVTELWKIKANDLSLAAGAVWNFNAQKTQFKDGEILTISSIPRPALLLMGLSLEALLKGLLIERDKSIIENGKLKKEIKTHDLNKLFKLAKIEISDSQTIEFIDRLSISIVWMGKYVIPLTAEELDKTGVRMFVTNLKDHDNFVKLYSIVLKEYK